MSEKTKVPLPSCRRQFDNLKRVMKCALDSTDPEKLQSSHQSRTIYEVVSNDFFFPDELVRYRQQALTPEQGVWRSKTRRPHVLFFLQVLHSHDLSVPLSNRRTQEEDASPDLREPRLSRRLDPPTGCTQQPINL